MFGWITLAATIVLNVLGNLCIKWFSAGAKINSPLSYVAPPFIAGVCRVTVRDDHFFVR